MLHNINDEPKEVAEISGSSSILYDMSDVTFRHFSSICLTFSAINKSNIRSGNLTLGSGETDRRAVNQSTIAFFP